MASGAGGSGAGAGEGGHPVDQVGGEVAAGDPAGQEREGLRAEEEDADEDVAAMWLDLADVLLDAGQAKEARAAFDEAKKLADAETLPRIAEIERDHILVPGDGVVLPGSREGVEIPVPVHVLRKQRPSTVGSLRGWCTWLILAINSPRPRVTSKKNFSAVTAAFTLPRPTPRSTRSSWVAASRATKALRSLLWVEVKGLVRGSRSSAARYSCAGMPTRSSGTRVSMTQLPNPTARPTTCPKNPPH